LLSPSGVTVILVSRRCESFAKTIRSDGDMVLSRSKSAPNKHINFFAQFLLTLSLCVKKGNTTNDEFSDRYEYACTQQIKSFATIDALLSYLSAPAGVI
jgi:hypothetical protein